MAPTRLLVLRMVDVVAEVVANYVAVSKVVHEGHAYEYLGLLLEDVIDN